MSKEAPPTSIQPELLEIRRYPNRRLYDMTRSKTVTLDELHRLVQEGYQIKVTETATGADITPRVLTQMILDLDSGKLEMFPSDLLHAVLQANEKLVGAFMETHFRKALEVFTRSQERFESQWKPLMDPPATPEWMQSWVAPFMPENGQAEGTDRDLRAVVGELARQVADLQEQMAEGKDLPPGKK